MSVVRGCLLILMLAAATAQADWQPATGDELQANARAAVDRFLAERPELAEYFDQAYGYAVFPRLSRGGLGWGLGYGKGVLVELDQPVGLVRQWRLSLGLQAGFQRQAQLILFRDAASLEDFKQGTLEFSGQASAAAGRAGTAADAAYLPEVAIFSLTVGGMMLEAAAAGVKYRFEAY